jgi:hypothetical protein
MRLRQAIDLGDLGIAVGDAYQHRTELRAIISGVVAIVAMTHKFALQQCSLSRMETVDGNDRRTALSSER